MIPKGITLHCSDSNLKAHDNIETIRRWHIVENGWSDVGYHWIVTKTEIHSGRPENVLGAHCKGFNDRIGICLTGRDNFTEHQFELTARIVQEVMDRYNFTIEDIDGHNKFNPNKTCPNFEKREVIKRITGPIRRSTERGDN